MTSLSHDLIRVAGIGIGATAVMDLWGLLLRALNIPTLNFALLGRWVAHLARGTVAHRAIAQAGAVRGELALGWLTHYAVGVVFAFGLVGVCGFGWVDSPNLAHALAFGLAAVAAPRSAMRPAMGPGIASARTPHPWRSRMRSIANHAVFGAGLYLAATAIGAVTAGARA